MTASEPHNDISIVTVSPNPCSDSLALTITLMNPCQGITVINDKTIPDQLVYLNDLLGVTFDPGYFDDTVGSLHPGVADFCGARTISFDEGSLV